MALTTSPMAVRYVTATRWERCLAHHVTKPLDSVYVSPTSWGRDVTSVKMATTILEMMLQMVGILIDSGQVWHNFSVDILTTL